MKRNRVKEIREKLLMSKTELARKAKVSAQTINRVEKGLLCRMETKKRIRFPPVVRIIYNLEVIQRLKLLFSV